MNYLAHILLSGTSPDVMIGNFIADSIKGSKYNSYPLQIQKGILLHRQIDTAQRMHIRLLGKAPNGFIRTMDIIQGL